MRFSPALSGLFFSPHILNAKLLRLFPEPLEGAVDVPTHPLVFSVWFSDEFPLWFLINRVPGAMRRLGWDIHDIFLLQEVHELSVNCLHINWMFLAKIPSTLTGCIAI